LLIDKKEIYAERMIWNPILYYDGLDKKRS
jgi:hypothetical protein